MELAGRTRQAVHLVEACPACYSSDINRRLTMTPDYRCQNCTREFDLPVDREAGKVEPPPAPTTRDPRTVPPPSSSSFFEI